MHKFKFITPLIAICLFNSLTMNAMAADVTLENPVIRATPPAAKVAAGYMTIINKSDASDRLISAKVDFAANTQIHEMKMVDGIMKMNQLKNGVEIEANGSATLKKGGNHLMFMKLKEPMIAGDTHKVTLTFEKSGEKIVEFTVKKIN